LEPTLQDNNKRIAAFFYGSFIRREVMALGGLHPSSIEVVKLSGYDIAFDPHANIFRSDQHAVCGILVHPSHEELHKLYARDGVGVFLPEAVVVETSNSRLLPAMCYMPPMRGTEPPDLVYVERIIEAAKQHGFPAWYVNRLESLCSSTNARHAT
jgi:AIG2-like family